MSGNLKENLNQSLEENSKENLNENGKENSTKNQIDHQQRDCQQKDHKHSKDQHRSKSPKESPKQRALSPKIISKDHHETDAHSIGNYTGLESLNLGKTDSRVKEKETSPRHICTCTCECDLCSNVRAYLDAKCLGIDYNLTNASYLSYLNHLSSNQFHDLKEHNLEHNFELENLEELVRLFPDSKIMIAIITFNMNGKHCNNLHELLLPDQLEYFPDVYVVGVQEYMRDSEEVKEWTIELQVNLTSLLISLIYD